MDPRFRDASFNDAPMLARMNQCLIRDEGHRNPMNLEQLTERMTGWLTDAYSAVVIELNGQTAGYALYRHDPDAIYLRQLYVAPIHRRTGLGRSVLNWLRQQACAEGQRICIDVLACNTDAIAFWRAVGFCDYCITMEWET